MLLLIAISLSMDTFSLSLSIGTVFNNKKYSILLSGVVGLFHFFMPILGSFLGYVFINNYHINSDLLASIIFIYIAINMFKEFKSNNHKQFNIGFLNMLLFAFGVSLDSFGVGCTFTGNLKQNIFVSLLFALFAYIFTYFGLLFGNKLEEKIGSYAILLGASIMVVLAIINLFNI